MNNFVITCCSTSDLSVEKFEELNIDYICFHYSLDGDDYLDDMGKTLSHHERYRLMVAGAEAKTSQVSIGEYKDFFISKMEQGLDVLHVTLSSGISGSYNSARIAMEEVREMYPNHKLFVLDSLAASSGYGLLMAKMAEMRNEGKSIQEVYEWAKSFRDTVQHWFFSTDLTFFIKGGRVSKTSGFIGGVLGICPLLNVNDEGKLIPREKVRSKKRVSNRVVDIMAERAVGGTSYNDLCYISHSDCLEDAEVVRDIIEARFPALKGKVELYDIGATIGSHTGPGTVALFFIGDKKDH